MAYKNIHDTFWTDPKLKKLSREARYLLLYLITNPHAHYSGIYYLPKELMNLESGIPLHTIDKVLGYLEDGMLIAYDANLSMVFVKNMLKHQLKQGNNRNMLAGILPHLQTLHKSRLIKDFLDHYLYLRDGMGIPSEWYGNTMPESVEVEVEVEVEEENTSAVSDKKPIAQPPKVEFGVQGFINITEKDREIWRKAYPALNIDTELAKMEAWVVANPKNRKSNWRRFITNWLSNAQDRSRPGFTPKPVPPSSPPVYPDSVKLVRLAMLQRGITLDDTQLKQVATLVQNEGCLPQDFVGKDFVSATEEALLRAKERKGKILPPKEIGKLAQEFLQRGRVVTGGVGLEILPGKPRGP